jgi:hypothetical protein
MKRGCLIALGVPVGLLLAVIVLLWFNFYSIGVRYRVTLEVQDGDQIKTGSSVIEAEYYIEPDWSPSGPSSGLGDLVGYAPTVDLGEKGMLFLTFEDVPRKPNEIYAQNKEFFCVNDDMFCLPFAAYGKRGTGVAIGTGSKKKAALHELLRQSGPREVPFAILPRLGRFLDINNPLSLVPVPPNNLATGFGPGSGFGAGVELKRVILELTQDPLTPPPAIWPAWLKEAGQMRHQLRGYHQ